MTNERPPLDWNKVAWAVGGVATVLTALFGSFKSCAVEEAHWEYVEETDSSRVGDEIWKDSVRVALDAHDRLHGPQPKQKKLRRVRVQATRKWWEIWR